MGVSVGRVLTPVFLGREDTGAEDKQSSQNRRDNEEINDNHDSFPIQPGTSGEHESDKKLTSAIDECRREAPVLYRRLPP